MLPVIKKTGNTSFVDGHGTRYWEYRLNPAFFLFAINNAVKGFIVHYSNDLSINKKFHCYIDQGFKHRELKTDSFREAINFLIDHQIKKGFIKA